MELLLAQTSQHRNRNRRMDSSTQRGRRSRGVSTHSRSSTLEKPEVQSPALIVSGSMTFNNIMSRESSNIALTMITPNSTRSFAGPQHRIEVKHDNQMFRQLASTIQSPSS